MVAHTTLIVSTWLVVKIANALMQFPGVEVDEITDSTDNISFKCYDEVSLSTIALSMDETNLKDNLSIGEWHLQVHCDSGDYVTAWYWLFVPKEEIFCRETPVFIKSLRKLLKEHYPLAKN